MPPRTVSFFVILLVRHAESVPPGPGFEDEFSRPLSLAGMRQSEELATELVKRGLTRLVSSPYLRAKQTLEPFAERSGLEIAIEPDFREHCMTDQPIRHWQEVLATQWADFDHALPSGESFNSTLARGMRVIREHLDHPGCTAIVGHGTIISLILNSIDPAFGLAEHLAMPNPALYRLDRAGDRLECTAIQLDLRG